MQISSGTKWKTTTFNFSLNAQGDFIQVSLKYIDYMLLLWIVFHLSHKGASFWPHTNAQKSMSVHG